MQWTFHLWAESDQQTKPSLDADKFSGRIWLSLEKGKKVSKQVKYMVRYRPQEFQP